MNFINLLKKLIIKSQLYVSICATLLGIFVLNEQESYQTWVTIILFLTFWNGYLFTVFHKKKDALLGSLVGFILITFLIIYFLNFTFYFKWLIILVLGLLYNADFFNINVREFSLIKTFYVGFTWATTLVFLPFQQFHWAWFSIIFLFVSGITFPFEIRDMEKDPFPTLPKVIGIRNTKILSVVFLTGSAIMAYFYLNTAYTSTWTISMCISILLVIFSGRKRSIEYYSFFMESLSALPIIVYFILNLKNK